MPRYLVTQSLLSSLDYVFNCWEGGEEDAMASFLQTLNREKSEPNKAMLDGIAFETLCYDIAAGRFTPDFEDAGGVNKSSYGDSEAMGRNKYPKNYNGAHKIASLIRGAQVQVRAQREIEVAGMTFLVYGVLDALKAGTISDVKYKTKSFGSLDLAGSYLDSPQHPAYFYLVPEAHEFQYLVSDGEDLYIERYTPQESRHISTFIEEFIDSVRSLGLLDLYKEKWEAAA